MTKGKKKENRDKITTSAMKLQGLEKKFTLKFFKLTHKEENQQEEKKSRQRSTINKQSETTQKAKQRREG